MQNSLDSQFFSLYLRIVVLRSGRRPDGAGPPMIKKPLSVMRAFSSFTLRLLTVAVLVSLPVASRAQRQTPGRPSLDGYVSFGPGFGVAGGGFYWCNYDFVGRTHFGLDIFREAHGFTEEAIYSSDQTMVAPESDYEFMATDVCGSVGYLYRLLAPRSRVIVLSAGGHLLFGAKAAPEMSNFKKSTTANYSAVGFFMGAVPEVQLELFPFRNVSLYVSARPRLRLFSSLGGRSDWFVFSSSFGAKVYL